MRKRRTREHVIADLSANFVERHFLVAGHTAERVEFDYGYDMFVQTFDVDGNIEPDFLVIQLKATDAPRYIATEDQYAISVDRRDLLTWQQNRLPVFLILYDAPNEAAFWIEIQRSEQETQFSEVVAPPATVTLRIPATNIMGSHAVAQMRRTKTAG